MSSLIFLWELLFVQPITNILIAFYLSFSAIGIPGAFGWAIICLAVLVRLVLHPLTRTQFRNMHKMQQLAPRLKIIKEKHGHDPKRHQEEQLKLYRAHGVNPAAGCLPLLLQMPFFIAVYQRLRFLLEQTDAGVVMAEMNRLVYAPFLQIQEPIHTGFFGASLVARPSDWAEVGWWILIVPIITGSLQFIQSKTMPGAGKQAGEKATEDKKESTEETMQVMQKQMVYFFPIMIGFFSYQFPLGLSLLWNTFSLFGIIQQRRIKRDVYQEEREKHD